MKCKYCGRETGREIEIEDRDECNFCWELRSRMEQEPELAQKILDSVKEAQA